MNKTCADCIHYDVCQYHITEETKMTVNECSHGFKDKSRYIELPCAVGDYVRFKGLTSLWKVDGIHFYREGLPQFNAINTNGKITTTFTELDSFEVVSKEEAEQVLQARTSKELNYVKAKDLDKDSPEFKEALESLKRL